MDNILDIEDALQEAGVFYNGLRGEDSHSHMDSYMTCINYKVLEDVWNKIKDKYVKEEWLRIAKYWNHNAYLSPNCYMLACFICRKIKVKMEEIKED
jgi:hypothetical protein